MAVERSELVGIISKMILALLDYRIMFVGLVGEIAFDPGNTIKKSTLGVDDESFSLGSKSDHVSAYRFPKFDFFCGDIAGRFFVVGSEYNKSLLFKKNGDGGLGLGGRVSFHHFFTTMFGFEDLGGLVE